MIRIGFEKLLARQMIGSLLVLTGSSLIAISLFGLIHSYPLFSQSGHECSRRILDYQAQLASSECFDVAKATQLVHYGTKHSIDRRIAWTENWVHFLLGQLYSPMAKTQNSYRLIQEGIADCSERAQILKDLAESAGCECSFIGLGGHVVLEIQTESGPWIADPDYGCVYRGSFDEWKEDRNKGKIARTLRTQGYTRDTVIKYIQIVQTTGDNTVLSPGRPLSPRLYRVERASDIAIWLLPLSMLATGLWMVRPPRSYMVS
jgi:hypothetical protein